jgi:transposase-like protein
MNALAARQKLIQTYRETGSIREMAQRWHTCCQVVRRWVRRYQAEGEAGLNDRSRRPHTCGHRTPAEIEAQVQELRRQTGYGPHRLALRAGSAGPFPLASHHPPHPATSWPPASASDSLPLCYPGAWAWETQEPFSLADVKDILDKHALGTAAWDHLRKHHLPRYHWTACEACTRMRFLASSHTRTRSIGVAFLLLVTFWLRAHGIERP